MIDPAEPANKLVDELDVTALAADRQRRDALLWNCTVLREAAAQFDVANKERFRRSNRHCRTAARPIAYPAISVTLRQIWSGVVLRSEEGETTSRQPT